MLPILLLDEVFKYLEISELYTFRLLNRNCACAIAPIIFQRSKLSYLNYGNLPSSLQRYAHFTRVFSYEPLLEVVHFEDGFPQLPDFALECKKRPGIHTLCFDLNREDDKEELVLATACLRRLKTISLRIHSPRESLAKLEPLFDRLTNLHLEENLTQTSKLLYEELRSNTLKNLELNINFKTKTTSVLKDLEIRLPKLETLHVYQVYDRPNTLIKYNLLTQTLYGIGFCEPYSHAIGLGSDANLQLFFEGLSLCEEYKEWEDAFAGHFLCDIYGTFDPSSRPSQFQYFDFNNQLTNPHLIPLTYHAERIVIIAPNCNQFNLGSAIFAAKEVILKLPVNSNVTLNLNWLINRFPNLIALEANFLSQAKKSRKFKNLRVFLTCSDDFQFVHSILSIAPKLKSLYSNLPIECCRDLEASFSHVKFLPYSSDYFK